MAISSPIDVKKINKTAEDSKRSIKQSQGLLANILNFGSKRIKEKKTAYTLTGILRDREEERKRRDEAKSELTAQSIVTKEGGSQQLVSSRSSSGFLERIIGFLGYLSAGWILRNLPTWIAMGKEFMARINAAGRILSDSLGSMIDIFGGIGSVLGAYAKNLASFDFLDTEGRVKTAMIDLNNSFGDFQKNMEEALGLITTPLSEGKYSGQNAPPLGSQSQDQGAYTEPGTPYSSSGGGEDATDLKSGARLLMRKGFPTKGAAYLAGNIQTESVWKAKRKPWVLNDGAGVNKGLISWNRDRIVNAERFLGKPLETASAGEQIDWIKEEMKRYGVLKTFMNPNATDEELKRASYTYIGWGELGDRWQASKIAYDYLQKYGPGTASSQQSSSSQQSQIPQVAPGNVNPSIGDRLGAGRNHGGVDLQVPLGTPLRAVSDGVIVDSDFEAGWGNFLVMKDNLGIYHLYGHMQSGYKRGGPVKKGEVIGKVGMTGRTSGPHLHWESGTGWNGGVIMGRFDALTKYSKYAPFNTAPGPGFEATPSTPAQISPSPTQQRAGVAPGITPDRRPQDIMVYQPANQQNIITSSGGGAAPSSTPINDFDLLNNFIKNKLLLDLAYL